MTASTRRFAIVDEMIDFARKQYAEMRAARPMLRPLKVGPFGEEALRRFRARIGSTQDVPTDPYQTETARWLAVCVLRLKPWEFWEMDARTLEQLAEGWVARDRYDGTTKAKTPRRKTSRAGAVFLTLLKQEIAEVLEETGGAATRTEIARRLGMDRRRFYRLQERFPELRGFLLMVDRSRESERLHRARERIRRPLSMCDTENA